jgi:hypothetical protein
MEFVYGKIGQFSNVNWKMKFGKCKLENWKIGKCKLENGI